MKFLRFIKKNLKAVIMYAILIIIIAFLLGQKVNYYVDELVTYVFANEGTLAPEDGVIYTPAGQPFVEAMSSKGLDIAKVWENQAKDTHPPFYYLIVHIICSVFRGRFSILFAGIINIVFAVLTFYMYRKIIALSVNNGALETVMSVLFILSPGILSNATFLRMYVMEMFFITALAYLVLKGVEHFEIRDFILIAATSVCGVLTHYYYLVFAFFISIIIVIIMLVEKRFKETLWYVLSMAAAGGVSCLIFPAMTDHIFKRGRGAESFENFANSDFTDQFGAYFKMLSIDLYGGILALILIIAVLGTVVIITDNSGRGEGKVFAGDKTRLLRYACLLVPSLCYVLIVSKSAPYQVDRYLYPVLAVALAGMMSLVFTMISVMFDERRTVVALGIVLSSVIIYLGFKGYDWPYLYLDDQETMSIVAETAPSFDAVVVYNEWWTVLPEYLQIEKCRSSSFCAINTPEEFVDKIAANPAVTGGDDIVLFITSDMRDPCIDYFMQNYPQYELLDQIGYGFYFRAN